MTEPRIQLTQETAFDLHRTLERRQARMEAEQRLHPRATPVLPAPPGCFVCGRPVEGATWEVIEFPDADIVHLDIDPCGHRFRADWEPLLTYEGDEHRWP